MRITNELRVSSQPANIYTFKVSSRNTKFKINNNTPEDVIDVILLFLRSTLTYLTVFDSVSIVGFEQVNVYWEFTCNTTFMCQIKSNLRSCFNLIMTFQSFNNFTLNNGSVAEPEPEHSRADVLQKKIFKKISQNSKTKTVLQSLTSLFCYLYC